ncbi:hypothetical protein CHU92_09710 [Flavobacterium cyanobacteriorum]|uniref:Type IX secretion system membrane protein PorP/SprF n=1 Tax=Flavobacterium cyanobacteriorum TaxID=2022802 RepID=A0A255Z616_9FLAO|nr:type IX secretion system membrane protein PorP/SprF [Flavobacterium cyanobacteriorum]OYQ36364.1 hypothetical protein CHU92_09710 [Flavobacterium cyanobacteriorum]
MKNNLLQLLIYLVVITTCNSLYSQQESLYTQYMYNTLSFNSAYAGSRENPSFLLLHRTQWVGIDGAPQTQNFSFHTPLRNQMMGLGLVVVNDRLGPSNETNVNANYSYSIYLNSEVKLSFGISAGVQNLNVDWSKGTFNNQIDPVFQQNINIFKPTVGAGTFLYTDNYYVGISVPNFLTTKYFDDVQSSNATKRAQYYVIGGYVFDLSPDVKFKPATLTKIISGAPVAIDLSTNFLFYDKFTLGIAASFDNSLSILTGYQITPNILLGYSYDYNTNNLGNYNNGSHEVFLRIELAKIKYISPRFF